MIPLFNLPNIESAESAQYENRVSTSPHSSPLNDPSVFCSEATNDDIFSIFTRCN